MELRVEDAIALLERTPALLNAWLRGLPENWTGCSEGGESWTAFDVVGHLIHGEKTDWIPRMRMVLEHGESRPFEPFDRFAQFTASLGKSLEQLLDEFAELRAQSLAALRQLALKPEDFRRRGVHPAFGPVTIGQLLSAWVVHDLTHLYQISRVMAYQYRDQVGPFAQYLRITKPTAESTSA